jgi:hypothetical protein
MDDKTKGGASCITRPHLARKLGVAERERDGGTAEEVRAGGEA